VLKLRYEAFFFGIAIAVHDLVLDVSFAANDMVVEGGLPLEGREGIVLSVFLNPLVSISRHFFFKISYQKARMIILAFDMFWEKF